jgi:hypothetical protein
MIANCKMRTANRKLTEIAVGRAQTNTANDITVIRRRGSVNAGNRPVLDNVEGSLGRSGAD